MLIQFENIMMFLVGIRQPCPVDFLISESSNFYYFISKKQKKKKIQNECSHFSGTAAEVE